MEFFSGDIPDDEVIFLAWLYRDGRTILTFDNDDDYDNDSDPDFDSDYYYPTGIYLRADR